MKYSFAFLFVFLICACSTNQLSEQRNQESLFELKSSGDTGVSFANYIVENEQVNGILYEYLYNGGGVASADLNDDGLPELFFVSNQGVSSLYLNKGNLQFQDITKISGVLERRKGFPTGVTLADVNADGLIDIYLCRSGKYSDPEQRKNLLFINQGQSKNGIPYFREEGKKYGLDLPHYSTQASFLDYDRDGDLDMFLINHGPRIYEDYLIPELAKQPSPLQSEQLFQNNDGYFANVSQEAGLIDNALSYGLGIAVGDLNNDDWPDVIVAHDFSQKDHIYLNQRNGTFREVSQVATNHLSYFSMGNDIADFNNDGWLDFISLDMVGTSSYDIKTSMSGMNPSQFYNLVNSGYHHQYMFNCLQLNQGIYQGVPRFSDIAQLAGVSNTDWSWSPLFFDVDNDGLQDLFVSNGIKRDFRNNDFVKYKQKQFESFFSQYKENTKENKLKARKLTSELVARMPRKAKSNYLFKNNGGLKFEAQSWLGENESVSNGAVYADLDGDGDLDLVLNNMDEKASIYENKSKNCNYLQVALKGPVNNELGLGSRVYIKLGEQTQIREQYATRGFQSASLGPLHFGIGKYDKVDSIIVKWPDGRKSIKTNVTGNQLFKMEYQDSQKGIGSQPGTSVMLVNEQQLPYRHKENEFDDFEREGLLPHKMSRFGPALIAADLDNDGFDELFVGGAIGQPSSILKQDQFGNFNVTQSFESEEQFEDVAASFVDLDGDGDLDLYVVTGGNEYKQGAIELNDRIYKHKENGKFELSNTIPLKGVSGGRVKPQDWDKDGDIDLLITGRQIPGHYPLPANSYLLRNNSENDEIILTEERWGKQIGMVTDASWVDLDKDGWVDLVVVGEWMAPLVFMNNEGTISDEPTDFGLSEERGWWHVITTSDLNNDGWEDLIIGNNGLNYKYKASYEEPFEIYASDFDHSGDQDIVLSYTDNGKKVPLRGRQCSSQEMPFIKDSFLTYHKFASASIADIYGEANLKASLKYSVTNFASCFFLNNGKGSFSKRQFPIAAQISNINSIYIDDINKDGLKDLLIGGNSYTAEVETTRNDASYGAILLGDGRGYFEVISPIYSGLYLNGDVRAVERLALGDKIALAIARNNDYLKIIFL